MKLIIDIQDFVYNHIKEFNSTQLYELNVITAIKNGTPLEEELEKIKQMILEHQEFACDCNCKHCGWFPCADIDSARIVRKDIKTIDKRISELKGENK